VTAGNSSGFNDGSAFVLMMTLERPKNWDIPHRQVGVQRRVGVDPGIMGVAPAYAFPLALKRAGLNLSDLKVIECNEAFAARTWP